MTTQRELEELTEIMYREGYYYGWIKALHAISGGFTKDEIEKHARGTLYKWKDGPIVVMQDPPGITRKADQTRE